MEKLTNWLRFNLAPRMNKINNNVWIVTLKDSIMQILPFIMLGSLFSILSIVENYISLPFSFWVPYGWTMGMLSVLVAFLIPFNFCEKKRLRKQRLIAGSSGLILFFIAITPTLLEEGVSGFSSGVFGAGGMFCSITTGIIICIVFNIFGKFSFFKEDSAIPDFVRQWFDAILPIGLIVLGGFLLVQVFNVNLYNIITNLFMPLQGVLNTWYGFILISFITVFIYSMGISGWVLMPVAQPIALKGIATNLALVSAGAATVTNMNMYTQTLMFTCYMWVGGIACTLPLVFMLARSKSKRLKALGRACIGPSILNINEPLVFGCIAWNPIMMIPMWIIGIVVPTITWIACKVIAFAPIPQIQFDLWYCPYPISTWIATQGSLSAIVLVIITITIAGVIWYPFFKVYEKECISEDNRKEEHINK